MQKNPLIVGIAFSLALVTVSHAQRGGITPEMIATALPLEGAPLAVPGPYKVDSGPAFGSPGHVVYRPADLAPFPGKDTLPVMVWGNGGCAINSTRYAGFLTTIASHGFVVLATAAQPGAERGRATADHLRAAIAWAEAENSRAGSPLNGKIALDRRPGKHRRRSGEAARAGPAHQRARAGLPDGIFCGNLRGDQGPAGVLWRTAQRRTYRDRRSSRRR